MREIILDTETTGLDPRNGDRVIEIGCVELINHIPSGRSFHRYLNPERSISIEAARLTGIEASFLADKPRFAAVVAELLEFIGDAPIIAHNAEFDLAFLNAELQRAGHPALSNERLVDTLMLARRKHPTSPNSLDALMARYQIDARRRTLHGALLDAELLAEVYVELIGGRQPDLVFGDAETLTTITLARHVAIAPRGEPRLFRVSEAEMAAHRRAIELIGAGAIWQSYLAAASGVRDQMSEVR